MLPTGNRGDRILDAIKLEMPGIKLQKWSFSPDGEKARVRRNSSHVALIAFMTNRKPGNTAMTTIQKELGLSSKTIKNLKEALRDADHPLTVKLKEIGVSLVSSGYGRGSKSYLLKA